MYLNFHQAYLCHGWIRLGSSVSGNRRSISEKILLESNEKKSLEEIPKETERC